MARRTTWMIVAVVWISVLILFTILPLLSITVPGLRYVTSYFPFFFFFPFFFPFRRRSRRVKNIRVEPDEPEYNFSKEYEPDFSYNQDDSFLYHEEGRRINYWRIFQYVFIVLVAILIYTLFIGFR